MYFDGYVILCFLVYGGGGLKILGGSNICSLGCIFRGCFEKKLPQYQYDIYIVMFLANNNIFFIVSVDFHSKVWKIHSGKFLYTRVFCKYDIYSILFFTYGDSFGAI